MNLRSSVLCTCSDRTYPSLLASSGREGRGEKSPCRTVCDVTTIDQSGTRRQGAGAEAGNSWPTRRGGAWCNIVAWFTPSSLTELSVSVECSNSWAEIPPPFFLFPSLPGRDYRGACLDLFSTILLHSLVHPYYFRLLILILKFV